VLQQQGVAAFVTEYGGPLSHTAILARNLRIPTVVGAHWARRYLKEGELLVVDSTRGVILAEVDDRSLAHYHGRQDEERRYVAALGGLRNQPAVTLDGREIHLRANIELLEDAFAARAAGAQGVGLYRTEFLYMNRIDTPDEEEHLAAYLEVLMALDGGPVTIRTLDLGADKPLATDRSVPTNPALGLRAIRLCLKEPALFLPQLRAILRASAEGAVRILIPMISSVREVRQVLALIDKTKQDLRRQGLAFDPRVPVGGMIEVPAAALIAAQLAQELDFLSIGTNDLIQYTLAIDRVDDEVNYLYDPLHPAILGLVHGTTVAGNAAGVPVSLCGELASDIRYTRVLLALGLTDLSIHPGDILDVKRVVTTTDVGRVEPLVHQLLTASHPDQTACLLEAINAA
jgi:phosphotransferase system enzyme I (PtsI)